MADSMRCTAYKILSTPRIINIPLYWISLNLTSGIIMIKKINNILYKSASFLYVFPSFYCLNASILQTASQTRHTKIPYALFRILKDPILHLEPDNKIFSI